VKTTSIRFPARSRRSRARSPKRGSKESVEEICIAVSRAGLANTHLVAVEKKCSDALQLLEPHQRLELGSEIISTREKCCVAGR
jgi:hypothetical protein